MNKIKELEEQLTQARQEAKEQSKEKYKYLIGTCLRPAFTSFHLVTGIDRSDGETVTYDCVSIYMDPRHPDSESNVSNKSWGDIEIEDLDRCKLDKADFDKALNEALRRIASSAKIEK